MRLPKDFTNLISVKIRKQIRDYLFYLLNHAFEVSSYFFQKPKPIKKFSKQKQDSQNEDDYDTNNERISNDNSFFGDTFLFENKLEAELGPIHKFRHTTRESKFHKPLFLKNRLHNKKRNRTHYKQSSFLLFSDNKRFILSKKVFRHISTRKEFDRIIIDKSKINQFL